MIQPDYIEILGPTEAPPRTNFPRGYMAGNLAGPGDLLGGDQIANAIADAFDKAIQGGPAGSKERTDRTEFFSDVLSKTGQKFVTSPKGVATMNDLKGTVRSSIMTISIPLFIAGLAVGYLLGSRK